MDDTQDSLPDGPAGRGAALRVLIVEDVPTVAAAIDTALRAAGMETQIAATGAEAIVAKAEFRPDVVLIDLELPDVNGLRLVERFAGDADCGVIVVTANGAEAARIAGLETGADDYVVKPFPPRELAARIRAVHRRLYRAEPEPVTLRGPCLVIDLARRLLFGPGDVSLSLTEAEAAALDALVEANGTAVSREAISQIALKRPLHAEDRSVDQLVLKLRRKIASLGASERTILSARRNGYVIPNPRQFRVLPGLQGG
jgi:DNA-binding response OmpR family regulator